MFDISGLGLSHVDPVNRCGQFRYLQQTAIGLATSDEVELTLSGGLEGSNVFERCRNLDYSLDYWQQDDVLKEVSFPHNRRMRSLVHFIRKTGWYKANPFLKVLRSHDRPKQLEQYLSALSENALRQTEIFHSPCSAFPEMTTSISGLRRVMTFHDMFPVLYPQHYFSEVQTLFKAMLDNLRPSDWVVCVSQCTKNDFCEYVKKIDPSRVSVIFLAADPVLFYKCDDEQKLSAVRRRYNIPEGPYVLSVCNKTTNKNQDHLVRCFTHLVRQEKIDDLNLVLVGPVSQKSQEFFNAIVTSGEIRDRIIYTGFIDDQDLAAIYSGATMFVYPSLIDGFTLPPIEAMQCGLPIITSNRCSLPEVVGDAGMLVDPLDRDQLCSSMLQLYQLPSVRAARSKASLARAHELSWNRCVRGQIDAYKAALSN